MGVRKGPELMRRAISLRLVLGVAAPKTYDLRWEGAVARWPGRSLLTASCFASALIHVGVAAASWSTPERVASLTGPLSGGGIQVTEDAAGDATIAWSQAPTRGSRRDEALVVTREAGGVWAAPVRLSSLRANASTPRAVVSATGETTVVWSEIHRSRGSARIEVLVRSRRAGRWGALHVLAVMKEKVGEAPAFAPEPDVALNAEDVPTVLFPIGPRETAEAVEVDRRSRDGRWPRPRVVAHTAYCFDTSLTFDAAGETLLAWTHGNPISPGSLTRIEALTLNRNLRPLSSPIALSPTGRFAYAPEIAANARGNAIVVWALEGHESAPLNAPFEFAVRTPKRPFVRAPRQSRVAREAMPGGISVDRAGTATAVFSTLSAKIVEVSTRPLAGNWSVPMPLSTTPAAGVVLAYDASEDLLAAWTTALPPAQGQEQGPVAIEATMRTADGSWQKPSVISPPHGRNAAVSMAASNRALAVWENESTHRLEAAQLPSG